MMIMMQTWLECMKAQTVDTLGNYAGEDWFKNWYIVITQSRDSGLIEKSNFASALNRLGGEGGAVQVLRFRHWACGWIEILLVDPHNNKACIEGGKIQADIENYPLLDEELYSAMRAETAIEFDLNDDELDDLD